MDNRIVFGIVIASLLFTGLYANTVAGNMPIENEILADNHAPIVNSPLDIVYVEGSTGHSITWEISDDDLGYWITTRDGELLNEETMEAHNETIIVDIDGLLAGNYEFMMLVSDNLINVTDIVLVTVLSADIEIHIPISIYGNTDFNDTAQSEGWIGNGTETNPFIIEKLFIEASYDCISIHGTTAYFVIRNCTFMKEGIESGIGINMQSVENGLIENCTFTNLWFGCITWFTSNCIWNENTFGNLLDGIWLQEAINCSITDNSFQSGGISLSGYSVSNWVHEISGNTIGEKLIGYFEGLASLDIDVTYYGQAIIANCSEVTVMNGDFSNVGIPISIGYSNFSGAYNCKVNGGRTGIFIERTLETSIDTCQIIGSTEVGLYINETIRTTVFNCTIRNIGYVGAQIGMGTNTTIIQTTIKGCGDTGIACFECPNFFLMDSIIDDNNYGLYLGGCPDSEIVSNSFQWNEHYGIFILWDCEGSRFFANVIGFSYDDDAYDDGSGTFWDDGVSIGNQWEDYSGVGYYYVPGSRGGIDHYPGVIDLAHGIDIIDLTDDITYILGTTGHDIIWYPNCTHPSMYSIFKDEVLQKQEAWDGSSISYNIDDLPIGVYNFTLEILDTFDETASDSVIVTVIAGSTIITTNTTTTETTSTTTTSNTTYPIGMQEFTLIISISSTVVIVVVIILIVRTKKSPM